MREDKIPGEDATPLDVMHKDDFRCIALLFRPDWTEEQFEQEWDKFTLARDKYYRQLRLN